MKTDRCALAVFLCLLFAANAALGQTQLPLFPKYQVLGVIYAPPGASSSVTYSNSTQIGSSHSIVSDSSTTTTQTQANTSSFNLFGLGYSNTTTTSDSWMSAWQNSSSESLQTTTGSSISVSGATSSGLGVLHDNDLIVIWLNPVIKTTLLAPITSGGVTTFPIQWSGFMFNSCDLTATQNPVNFVQLIDGCDPYNFPGPDIVYIPVFCLKNPYFNPATNSCGQYLSHTSRFWDLDQWGVDSVSKVPVGPGLTIQDYADILQSDPFVTQTLVANNTQASENVYTNPCHPAYGINFDPNVQETIPDSTKFTPPFLGTWPAKYCGPPNTPMERFNFFSALIPYPAPQPNGGTTTSTGFLSNSAINSTGTQATDTHSHSFNESTSLTFAAEATYSPIKLWNITNLSAGFSFGTTSGSGTSWSDGQTIGHTATHSQTDSASYSVTGPKGSDNWNGPITYNVYQDTVYGTFAFRDPNRSTTTALITAGKASPIGVAFTGSPKFGTVAVGKVSAAITVTLTNNSPNQMTMLSPALSFSDLAVDPTGTKLVSSFAIVAGSDLCSNKVVLAGKTCTLKIHFAPVLNAAPNAIQASYPVAAYVIASGNELVPVVDAGATAYNELVLVTNTVIRVSGTTETAVTVSGTATPGTTTEGATLYPNVTCSAQPCNTYTFASELGGSPTIQTEGFTFKNYYNVPVTLSGSTSTAGSGFTLSDAVNYSISSDGCSGRTVASLGTCAITLKYDPVGTLTRPAVNTKITISGTPQSGTTIPLTFAGASGPLTFIGISVNSSFSLTCYITQNSQSGSCGASTTLTLTNTGSYPVVLKSPTGTNGFFGSAGGTLAAGASTGVSVGADETCNNGPFGNCSFSGTVSFTGTAQTGGSGTPVSASSSGSLTTIFCPSPCIPPTGAISSLGQNKTIATFVNPAWATADLSNSPVTATATGVIKNQTSKKDGTTGAVNATVGSAKVAIGFPTSRPSSRRKNKQHSRISWGSSDRQPIDG